MKNPPKCFDDQTKVTKLKLIKKTIQHKETSKLAQMSGLHVSLVSSYLNHAGKIVLNQRRVDKIIDSWAKMEDDKERNYFDN
jgi:hypothetical protein